MDWNIKCKIGPNSTTVKCDFTFIKLERGRETKKRCKYCFSNYIWSKLDLKNLLITDFDKIPHYVMLLIVSNRMDWTQHISRKHLVELKKIRIRWCQQTEGLATVAPWENISNCLYLRKRWGSFVWKMQLWQIIN